jgi:spore maturation protein CgeB
MKGLDTMNYFLAHEEEREAMRLKGFNQVKYMETYTNRMKEILETVL